MKKTMSFILSMTFAASAFAQNGTGTKDKNKNQSDKNSSVASKCSAELASQKAKRLETPLVPISLSNCENLIVVAKLNKASLQTPAEKKKSVDNKYQCERLGGFTADYNDCTRVLSMYNGVYMAEQAMHSAQSLQVSQKNTSQTKEVAARSAQGDGQNAAIDAVIARNEMNAKLYKTQALTYTAAVGALSSQLARWEGLKGLNKKCASADLNQVSEEMGLKEGIKGVQCSDIVLNQADQSLMFQNQATRTMLELATAEYLRKAADARKQAGISEYVGDRYKNAAAMSDDEDLVLDKCVVAPTDPACVAAAAATQTGTGTFAGNTIDFGNGTGGLEYDPLNPNTTNDLTDPAVTGDSDVVSGISSPFEDDAKAANGILDPAAAATLGAGSPASAPAGGGGAGGGGGGSASLGNDLAGANSDANKDPDVNSSKVNGKYKEGAGGGFQAVSKGRGDSENPFASMFDTKGENGGVEEDRSIASDGNGPALLFQRISAKYSEVEKSKRIESQNLE